MTYDMGIDQARHDEFAGLRAEIDEVVLARLQFTRRSDSVVDGRWLYVVLDPDDIAIQPDGNQAPRRCVIVPQCLWIDDWAIVDVDNDVETKALEGVGSCWDESGVAHSAPILQRGTKSKKTKCCELLHI